MKKEKVLNILVKVLIVVVGILLVFLASLSLVTLFLTKIKSEVSGAKERNVYKYRHVQYNPETLESIPGFISTYKEMTSDFISYENSDGIHTLISNYGTREYQCRVKCYCENNENRRTSVVLSKTLVYLVAAASSLAAYSIAKDHLKQRCSEAFSDCPYASIEVDEDEEDNAYGRMDDDDYDEEEDDDDDDDIDGECVDMFGYYEDEFERDESINEEVEKGKFNPMIFVNFICDGHCLKKDFYYEQEDDIWHIFNGEVIAFPDFAQKVTDEYGCEKMELEQIVDFLDDGTDLFEQESKARRIFTHSYLALFCEDHSHVRFDEFKETHQRLSVDEIGDKDKQTASVCLGYDRKTLINTHVNCRKTFQEPYDPYEDIETGGAY